MKKKLSDIEIPWYVKIGLIFCKSRFSLEVNNNIKTIQRYKQLCNKKYILDFDIKNKKTFFGITIKF